MDLDLADRVFETTERQCFATFKDHKINFNNNPSVRLINRMKPEIGKIAKKIQEKINHTVRAKSKLQQWRNATDDSTKPKIKEKVKFVKFDVCNFYKFVLVDCRCSM